MSASIVFHGLAAIAYGILALSLWLPIQKHQRSPHLDRTFRVGLLAALIIHGTGLLLAIILPQGLHIGWALALSAGLWLGMVVFWFESLYLRLDSLLLILLPTAALVSLITALFPEGIIVHHADNDWLRVHLLIALAAYGLSGVAAMHAILITVLDRQLHRPVQAIGQQNSWYRALDSMPPLMVQETLLFRLIRFAFIVLTLTVLTGIAVSLRVDNQLVPLDHKTLFTLLSWLTFGALLIGRRLRGWRGRTALKWTLAGFCLLLLAYTGSRFVLDVILQRGPFG